MSHKKGIAGTSVALITSQPQPEASESGKPLELNGLGQRYGGDAWKRVSSYGPIHRYEGSSTSFNGKVLVTVEEVQETMYNVQDSTCFATKDGLRGG